MFTGLVEETGEWQAISPHGKGWRVWISADKVLEDVALGDSIAVNGCCLTVAAIENQAMAFDVLEETLRRTSFRDLPPGSLVNLERSLSFNGKLGGHFVTGHIDATGQITAMDPVGGDVRLTIQFPAQWDELLVEKGSIAIEGISLTVAALAPGEVTVWLIPHTVGLTNLRSKKVGDPVNLEFDLLAKHVAKLLRRGDLPSTLR